MTIILRPISNLENFDTNNFAIAPWSSGFKHVIAEKMPIAFEKAKELSKFTNDICVALLKEGDEMYVLCERDEEQNNFVKFVLFNASETSEEDAIIHAFAKRNTEMYEKYFRFEKGSIA